MINLDETFFKWMTDFVQLYDLRNVDMNVVRKVFFDMYKPIIIGQGGTLEEYKKCYYDFRKTVLMASEPEKFKEIYKLRILLEDK